MNTLFVADIQLKENEGIYKKVLAQANGLNSFNGNGWLITKKDKGSRVLDLGTSEIKSFSIDLINEAKILIQEHEIEIVYIRHMIPSIKLIMFLCWMRKKSISVFYEIPTYPYYAEQFRTSRRKYRAIVKLMLDTFFWPFIYLKITKLVVIKSNSNVHMFKKMVEITNGADIESIEIKKYSTKPITKVSMATVGTLYPYHGYDRIIRGLVEYERQGGDVPVEFHVIGESDTINDLKKQVNELCLENVFFHGTKNSDELNRMFQEYDIGLGSVALHRRNANIDTTIKIIEYYCRGMVVATSGVSPMDQYDSEVTIHIEDTDEPVNIQAIVDKYCAISTIKKEYISDYCRKVFSWKYIMHSLVECTINTR